MALALTLFDPGTLSGLLAPGFFLIAIGLAAWAYARVHIGKAQEQAIGTWRQLAEGQEARAKEAEEKADQQRELKHGLQTELAAEKLLHDQTTVLTALAEVARQQAETALQIKQMEERVVEQMAAQTVALKEITTTLMNGNGKH